MFDLDFTDGQVVVPEDKEIIHFAYIIGVDDYYLKNSKELIMGIIDIFTYKVKPSFIREAIIKQKGKKKALLELMAKYKIEASEYEDVIEEYKYKVKCVNKNLVKELGITYDELGTRCTRLETECVYKLVSLMRK